MATGSLAILVFILCSSACIVSGLECYQCNLECRNGTGEGCHAGNVTLGANQTRVPCDQPEEVSGCVACVKVKTVVRQNIGGGEFSAYEIVSKVCQIKESAYDEDTCDRRGPGWATNVICHCYSDLCNSAHRLLPAAFPVLALILHALL